MSEKPIIRHCFNCEHCDVYDTQRSGFCNVKYKALDTDYNSLRLRAALCRFYRQKVGAK